MTMTNEEYVAKGGVLCPYCESDDLTTHSVRHEGTKLFQSVTCSMCDSSWTDEFVLTGFWDND